MDDYASRIADLLEEIARRVRALTVDRVEKAAKWIAIAIVILVLALLLFTFTLIGVFRILGSVMPMELAYLLVGGIFLVIGVFFWRQRRPRPGNKA